MGGRIDYLTPTAYAEQAYEARAARGMPMGMGSAGIPLPNSRALYRPTVDGPLLGRIVRAAYLAHCEHELPQAAHDAAALTMVEDLAARFPAADMAVLERYGLASSHDMVIVGIDHPESFIRPHRMGLPSPVKLPRDVRCLRVSFEGARVSAPSDPEVAESLAPFFLKLVELHEAKARFNDAVGWPGQFKCREKRWPRWWEIERDFPPIKRWLGEQRTLTERQKGTDNG